MLERVCDAEETVENHKLRFFNVVDIDSISSSSSCNIIFFSLPPARRIGCILTDSTRMSC